VIRLVLASGSPRRREILDALGLAFDVRPPDTDETLRPGEAAVAAAVRLATEKAEAVPAAGGELVLAADTIVVLGEEILGKPADEADAARMLGRLSGRAHRVVTGIALRSEGRTHSSFATTGVRFRELDADDIAAYVATGEPLDKAGAYGIQGYGAALVEGIEGDFFNVMGLPVPALLGLLRTAGYRYLYGELVALPGAAAGGEGSDERGPGNESGERAE
jgi:septum formation protein